MDNNKYITEDWEWMELFEEIMAKFYKFNKKYKLIVLQNGLVCNSHFKERFFFSFLGHNSNINLLDYFGVSDNITSHN